MLNLGFEPFNAEGAAVGGFDSSQTLAYIELDESGGFCSQTFNIELDAFGPSDDSLTLASEKKPGGRLDAASRTSHS